MNDRQRIEALEHQVSQLQAQMQELVTRINCITEAGFGPSVVNKPVDQLERETYESAYEQDRKRTKRMFD